MRNIIEYIISLGRLTVPAPRTFKMKKTPYTMPNTLYKGTITQRHIMYINKH